MNIDQVLVLNSGSKERGRFGPYCDEVLEVGWTESAVHNIRQMVRGKPLNQILSTTPENYRPQVFMDRTYDLSRITGKLSRSEIEEYLTGCSPLDKTEPENLPNRLYSSKPILWLFSPS